MDERDPLTGGAAHVSPGRVVIVTPQLWGVTGQNGGIATSVFHLARLLRLRGDDVTVVVGVAKPAVVAEPWLSRYGDAGIGVEIAVARGTGRDVADGPYRFDFPFAAISEAVMDAVPRDAEIVYAQDWSALGLGLLRRRKLTESPSGVICTILRGSSAWAHWGDAPDESQWSALRQAERFAVEESDVVVAASDTYREWLSRTGVRLPEGDRTRLLGHPWLPFEGGGPLGPSAPGSSFRRLVYFGRLETRKGVDLFLEALAALGRRGAVSIEGLQVLFVGPEGTHARPSLDAVSREVAALGAEPAFQTDLDPWEVAELFRQLRDDTLMVIPSLRENYPNAVIEATIVEGLNVICSDVGGVSAILDGRGADQLFAPTPAALTDALERWLAAGPRSASELVEYDWRSANARWIELHEELLLRARAGSVRPGLRRMAEPGVEVPAVSLVISAYKSPDTLAAILAALADQSDPDFEIVVADDGHGDSTKALVERWTPVLGERLTHVCQEDRGFRLARVLDLGALVARADYLVFVNDDSVPRRHFVRAVRAAARPGWFLAGRRIQLSEDLTAKVLGEWLPVQRWPLSRWWLHSSAVAGLGALTPRDRRRVGKTRVPEFAPHDRGYGYLAGVSRRDFERVNGYDTRFVGWGEEDVDLAVRLLRLGLRCGHAGPQATLVHLWHESRVEEERANWCLLQETEQSDRIEAVVGLRELARELGWDQLSANRVGSSRVSLDPVNS